MRRNNNNNNNKIQLNNEVVFLTVQFGFRSRELTISFYFWCIRNHELVKCN